MCPPWYYWFSVSVAEDHNPFPEEILFPDSKNRVGRRVTAGKCCLVWLQHEQIQYDVKQ